MIRMLQLAVATMLGMSLIACSTNAADGDKAAKAEGNKAANADKKQPAAVVMIKGVETHKDVKGRLTLTEVEDGVRVVGQVTGLTPGKHGFHVHQKGDLSDPKLVSAGGHFNPGNVKHGGPDSADRHAGDWGNIVADEKGVAKVDATFKSVSLQGEQNGIVGRSVIVHAAADDLATDPSGNSGDRIAGGVIEMQKSGSGAKESGGAKKEAK